MALDRSVQKKGASPKRKNGATVKLTKSNKYERIIYVASRTLKRTNITTCYMESLQFPKGT